MIEQIGTLLTTLDPNLVSLVLTAFGVSGGLQVLKTTVEKRVGELKPSTGALLMVAAAAATTAVEVVTSQAQANPTIFGAYTTLIVGLLTLVYRVPYIGIKPLSDFLKDAKAYRAAKKDAEDDAPVLPAYDNAPADV